MSRSSATNIWKLLLVGGLLITAQVSAWALAVGDRVQVVCANTAVARSPGGSAAGFESSGSLGLVLSGPALSSGSLWWNVSFDDLVSGWVIQGCLTSVAADQPTLVSPGSLASPGQTVYTVTPVLVWNAARGATNYMVGVADMSFGGAPIANVPVATATSYAVPSGLLSFGHVYAWDVTSQNDMGFSQPSARLYFQTQPPPPAVPVLISPGAATNPGPRLSTLTPTLSWAASAGATGYGIYIYDVAAHSYSYANDAVGNKTSMAVPAGILANNRVYGWQMRASNASGFSAYSSYLYFQTPPPTPTLTFTLSGNSLALSWPTNALGFQLESTPSLLPPAWSPVLAAPAVVNTNFVLATPISAAPGFFRLKQ